jgi:hypothetical protein
VVLSLKVVSSLNRFQSFSIVRVLSPFPLIDPPNFIPVPKCSQRFAVQNRLAGGRFCMATTNKYLHAPRDLAVGPGALGT